MTIVAIFVLAAAESPMPYWNAGFFAVAVIVEAAVVLAVLRFAKRSVWLGALVAAFISAIALWFSAQDTLGAPEHVFVHQRWLVALILACLVLAARDGIVRFTAR